MSYIGHSLVGLVLEVSQSPTVHMLYGYENEGTMDKEARARIDIGGQSTLRPPIVVVLMDE